MTELHKLMNALDACPYVSYRQAQRWLAIVREHKGAFAE